MNRYPWRYLLAAAAAAWAVDFLFWNKPLGISFLIWSVLVVGCGFLLARSEGRKIAKQNVLLVVAIFLLAGVVFLRLEPFTQVVSFLFGSALILLLSSVFLDGHWVYFRVVDYIAAGFHAFVAAFSRPLELSKPGEKQTGEEGIHGKRLSGRVMPVFRGLLLAVPVVLVLGGLLAAADPIFSDWAAGWLDFFKLEHFAEFIFRSVYILVLAYLFTGLYLFAIRPKRQSNPPDPNKSIISGFLGITESAVVLTSVNLLFAVFLLIQIRYFFGGSANIHSTGYTFAEYARRGFGELVVVAVLSLMLYLGLGTITRADNKRARMVFTVLAAGLIVQVMVILVSAFQRLLLYENAYGFTRLRTYSHIFMIWLGVLLAVLLVLEVVRQRGRFALALLATVFGFCMTLALVNVDGLVVRQNVQRAATSELDGDYLKTLSPDAVPAMAALFVAAEDPDIREILGAELACRSVLIAEGSRPWQGYSWSRQFALQRLADLEQRLEAYPLTMEGREWMVEVDGEKQSCLGSETLAWD